MNVTMNNSGAIEDFSNAMDRAAREGFEEMRRAYAAMFEPVSSARLAVDIAERFKLQARPVLPSFRVEMPKLAGLFALPDRLSVRTVVDDFVAGPGEIKSSYSNAVDARVPWPEQSPT
jgi:hypothetical protein